LRYTPALLIAESAIMDSFASNVTEGTLILQTTYASQVALVIFSSLFLMETPTIIPRNHVFCNALLLFIPSKISLTIPATNVVEIVSLVYLILSV
jgi:hypothetical protein